MSERSCLCGLVAGFIGLISTVPALGQPVCRPLLAFQEIRFSPMQPPTMERQWTAIVSVDASPCKARSAGYFEIGFLRLKENGLDIEFREEFMWLGFEWAPSAIKVELNLAADEAVERPWFDNVTPCPCRGG